MRNRENFMTVFSLHVSGRTWLALLLLAFTGWLATTHFPLILEISTILLGAFLLSLAIAPLAERLARWRVPRGVTVLSIYIGLIGLARVLGDLLAPVIDTQTQRLRTHGPALFQELMTRLTALPWLNRWLPSLGTLSQQATSLLNTLLPTLLNTAVDLGDLTLNALVLLVLAYFLVTDGALSERFMALL